MFDQEQVNQTIALPPAWVQEMRTLWLTLQELSVWGDLKTTEIGLIPKLRKRLLDLGEKLRSVANVPTWLPHPREQIKNALASSLNLMESLQRVEELAKALTGGADLSTFHKTLDTLRARYTNVSQARDEALAKLLDSQYEKTKEELAQDKD